MTNIILNATFSNEQGKTLSFKDLKFNQKVYVAGTLDNTKEIVKFLCRVKGKMLFTETDIYSYVPAEAALIENSMDMKIKFFRAADEEELLFVDNNIDSLLETVKTKVDNDILVQAYGDVVEHYRFESDENEPASIMTSMLKDIFKEGDNIYIKTRNSIYRLIS